MTRENFQDRELGDELSADIIRYQKRGADVSTLIVFVYDPGEYLKNPDGLENDLTKRHNALNVKVIVQPKR